jgi:hypothetical protein
MSSSSSFKGARRYPEDSSYAMCDVILSVVRMRCVELRGNCTLVAASDLYRDTMATSRGRLLAVGGVLFQFRFQRCSTLSCE